MFRKFAIATVAVATLATAAVTIAPNEAHARNRNRAGAVAAGAIIGLAAGAIIGSQVRPRYYAPVSCHNEPVRRWDPYYRQYVIVGYRQVCF